MKKLVLMACLMSAMIFAACSNAYDDSKEILKDYEKALDNAKTCEDVKKATADFEEAGKKFDEKYKNDSTTFTKEQEEEIEKLAEKVVEKAIAKSMELCD